MNTFLGHLELTALGNLDCLDWLVTTALWNVLDLFYNIVSLQDLAEDDVAAVEPAGDHSRDEELRAVGVLSTVGHAEETLACVLELEVLIGELGTVDGLAACAISGSEVSPLNHELLDHAVEGRALVAKALLSSSQSTM